MSASDGRSWTLARSDTQRKLIASLVYESEPGWVVRLEPPRRSLSQNALFHSLVAEAVQKGLAADDGRRLTFDEAKVALVSAWMIEEGHGSDIIAFRGNAVQLRRSTTTLDKDEFGRLIECTYMACAEKGIVLGEKAA